MIPALDVAGLAKSYGALRAVIDVGFAVPEGSITALIGPNGAGKTTLFNLITNLDAPSAGEARFFGRSLAGMQAVAIAALGLIRTFQTARVFPGMTARENVLTGAHLDVRHGAARQMLWLGGARREERRLTAKADSLLALARLEGFADMPVTELPMGGQKLIEVLRALMARPRMLLLDEPAAGLNDQETAELAELLRAVRDAGITIMVIEHNMSLVMGIADNVIVLDAGSVIAQAPPSAIRNDRRVIEAYVGAEPNHA
jgi:branched-chain amino acid transport system ATP-binding protein